MIISLFQNMQKLWVRRAVFTGGMILLLSCSACTSVTSSHGYVPAQNKPLDIKAHDDTKATVLARLGNPSTTGVFEHETWYYMSSTRRNRAYFKTKTKDRSVIAIAFDKNGTVSDVEKYGLKDGQVVAYIKKKTPTRGRELSTLQQILGNIGRLPQNTLGGDKAPGGGR